MVVSCWRESKGEPAGYLAKAGLWSEEDGSSVHCSQHMLACLQAMRHYVAARWPGDVPQRLQKTSIQATTKTRHHLTFTIVRSAHTIKGLQLIGEREDPNGQRASVFEISLRMIAHHGVEECFGRFQYGAKPIDCRSLRHPFDEKSRQMWHAIRLFCTNLLLWDEEQMVLRREDLDQDEWVRAYLHTIGRMASGR